jgi:hypothetical protein
VIGSWTPATRQAVVRIAVPALVLAGLAVPAVALASRLPNPIAIHWGLSAKPNGHAPWWAETALLSLLWCVAWVSLLRGGTRRANWAVANLYGIGGLALGVQTAILSVNLDRASWRDAPLSAGWIVASFGAAVAAGAIGWALAGPDRPAGAGWAGAGWAGAGPDGSAAVLPSAGLAPGERAVWADGADNRWMLLAVPVGVAIAVFGSSQRAPVVLGVAVLIALVISHVSVVAGPAGVTTTLGLLRWPRWEIPLTEVVAARTTSVAPLAFGGYGMRRRPGLSAVIVRSGEALELELTNGRRFVVTVDGAEQAAGVINDHLTGSRSATP